MAYTKRYKCVECKTYMSDHTVSYSDGVCPYCGHKTDSTFCEVTEEVGEWVQVRRTLRQVLLFRWPIKKWVVKDG